MIERIKASDRTKGTVMKSYSHRFKEVNSGKFLVRLIDMREEMPKSGVNVEISGVFNQMASMSVDDARALEKALHVILRRITHDRKN